MANKLRSGTDRPTSSTLPRRPYLAVFPKLVAHRFSSRDRFGFFALYIRFSAILPRHKDKQTSGKQHKQSKERVVICSLQIDPHTAEVRLIEIDSRGNEISDADRKKPKGHHRALHLSWSLGVGEFETGNRYHHFSSGEQNVPRQLPKNVRLRSGVELQLNPPKHDERQRRNEETDADLAQWRER